jgi:hypothetical protein
MRSPSLSQTCKPVLRREVPACHLDRSPHVDVKVRSMATRFDRSQKPSQDYESSS